MQNRFRTYQAPKCERGIKMRELNFFQNRRRKSGLLAFGLAAVLLLGILTGCGHEENGYSESGGYRGGNEHKEENGDPVTVRVGSLKGPTSLGILFLMEKAKNEETRNKYRFRMAAGADELLPLMAKGELDIALLPANAAAILYEKTNGAVTVADVNTLSVLYLVTGSKQVRSVEDLKGRTIYLTGKGTTPEAVLRFVLHANGLNESDYHLEFQPEAAQTAVLLAKDPEAVGLLPQPFVTAALMQNEALQAVLDMGQEWTAAQNTGEDGSGHPMVTGVTVVRKAFLEEHPEAVAEFIREHRISAEAVLEDVETGAVLAVEAGIVAKEAVAEEAIPQCGITCLTGKEMREALSAYLEVLAEFDSALIGGELPGEDFYFEGNEPGTASAEP